MGKKYTEKMIVVNKRAPIFYQIMEKIEAGIVLLGWEVKSCRENRVSLKDSYASFKGNEIFLFNLHIAPYPYATGYSKCIPERIRKLLLHKAEIKRLIGYLTQRGFTLIPLRLYFKKGRVKVELGIAKGKKKFDRRKELREKAISLEINRALKRFRH